MHWRRSAPVIKAIVIVVAVLRQISDAASVHASSGINHDLQKRVIVSSCGCSVARVPMMYCDRPALQFEALKILNV